MSQPLGRSNSSGNLDKSREEKADEPDIASNSKQAPETRQKARPRAGTWKHVTAPSQPGVDQKTEPMLSPRRTNPATDQSIRIAKVPVPVALIPAPASSPAHVPVASTSATPSSSSSAATPGKTSVTVKAYDKSRVDGDDIPDSIANALRAGFQRYDTVPDPANSSKTKLVPVFNLPPKQIATLWVGLESNFGREKLTGEKMDKPLRDKFGIKNLRLSDVSVIPEINFIAHILKPFIEKEFGSKAFEKVRLEVRDKFNTFASVGNEVLLETQKDKNAKESTIQNLAFMTQFESVIMPLVELICGADRKLESSSLSRRFKDFLLEIDRSCTEWAETQGKMAAGHAMAGKLKGGDWEKAYALANVTAPDPASSTADALEKYQLALAEKCRHAPAALFALKKAALVGVLFNRALLENWVSKFHAESQDPQEAGQPWVKHKAKLNGTLGHYTSFKFDDLFIDIMASQPQQLEGFKEYLAPMKKLANMRRAEEIASTAKQSNKCKALERSATVSAKETEKAGNERKAGITNFIQGMISPRKKAEEAPPSATTEKSRAGLVSREARKPHKTLKSSEGELLKNTETRKLQRDRSARAEMKAYLKQINQIAFDVGYTTHMNIVITTRANYEDFQLAPAAFCLLQLAVYRKSVEAGGNMAPVTLDKIEQALTRLVITEKQAAELALRSQSAKAAPKPGPRMPALDLTALKRSPFADDDEAQEKTKSSEETEKSDSSEVVTESSSEATPEREKS